MIPLLRLAALTALLAVQTLGQTDGRPPAFAEVAALAANVSGLGKLSFFRDPGTGELRAFSAHQRRWISTATPGRLFHANDWLAAIGSTEVAVLGARAGGFHTRTFSPNRQVLNDTRSNDSVLAVLDNMQLHLFVGLVGDEQHGWISRPLIHPTAQVDTNRDVTTIVDGNTLVGVSGAIGTFVETSATGTPIPISVAGSAALIETATEYLAFSAVTNTWSRTPSLGSSFDLRRGTDTALIASNGTVIGYSALRSRFVQHRLPPVGGTTTTNTRLLTGTHWAAVVRDLSDGRRLVSFFAGGTATWTDATIADARGFSPRSGETFLATADGDGVLVFDGLNGTSAGYREPGGRQTFFANSTTSILGAGPLLAGVPTTALYSTLTGAWHDVPAPVLASAHGTVFQGRSGALLLADDEVYGFDARHGLYTRLHLQHPTDFDLFADSSTSILLVRDGPQLFGFDARRSVWSSVDLADKDHLQVNIWRTIAIAHDGVDAYVFGSQAGRFERTPAPGSPSSINANSEVGTIVFNDRVLGASPLPAGLGVTSQFPEFRRVTAEGGSIVLEATADPGDALGGVLGKPLIAATVSIQQAGDLALDGSSTPLIPFGFFVVPASGRLRFSIDIPSDPRLQGLDFGLQSLVLEPMSATLWLGDPSFVHVR